MDMAAGKLEQVFHEITHFYNSFIMHYTEYFTLQDCSGFLQIRSHLPKVGIKLDPFILLFIGYRH